MTVIIRLIVTLTLMILPSPVFAWGAEGHEIVAGVARSALSPAARNDVGGLLGGESMLIHDSNWADEVRDQRPDSRLWHFVDIPLEASGYDARRDCAGGDCVVAQITRDVRIVANRRLPAALRAEALRFLIHFVADVHQPLHAEDNDDHGGNGVRVYLRGQRTNLHHIWDVSVVEALGFDANAVSSDIVLGISSSQRKSWQAGTPESWANEAHAIAREEIYNFVDGRRTLRLPPAYLDREKGVTRAQLAKAGLRLAWLLNGALN
jgi:hypothetical protein